MRSFAGVETRTAVITAALTVYQTISTSPIAEK